MSLTDITGLVQSSLPNVNVSACIPSSLLQGWVRTTRYLAVVSCGYSTALFVLLSNTIPPVSVRDIIIERILPIDDEFKCDIESRQNDGTDLCLNITSNKLKLLFELVLGEKSNMFVSEIYKAAERVNRRHGPFEFNWVNKYSPILKNDCDEEEEKERETLDDSPDISLPRESIANGTTLIAARETVIRYQMSMKEHEFTYKIPLRVFVGTWNVNGQQPSVGLAEWLACDEDPPDVYAIGFQELDLSKEAFLFGDTPREEEWRKMVAKALHNGADYRQISLVRLVGMMLIVYVKKSHQVKNVAVDRVGTGIMGKMGNKGGVSIRMEIYNTTMCFVNAHLAAHIEEFERRNQDFNEICSRTSFAVLRSTKTIKDHDQVYWLGDLNYRITGLDVSAVKDYIQMEHYRPILEYDQLTSQRRLGTVFSDFKEGSINFMPTYKYDTGTDDWDSSEKNRAPAWCDRILWKGDSIEQLKYRSHQIYRISDHKPVSSVFMSGVRVIDEVKHRKILEEVMKRLDKLENEFLPQVTVDNTEIKFDTITFQEPQTREFIIANIGQVPVTFEFITKLDDVSYCKEWLSVEPSTGDVNPGDKCDIKLKIHVDKNSAYKLNSGQDKLYDILVLHLVGGKDIFITVQGEYERSCFGCSLETLANLSVPIKEVPFGKLVEMEKNRKAYINEGGGHLVPKEVWFLVDYLHRHGMKKKLIFINSGYLAELEAIRNWLDSWPQDPLPGSPYSVAEALVLLLESTEEPIIPYKFHFSCLEASSNYLKCKQIVQQLPFYNKTVFVYLCLFLKELLTYSDENGLDIKTLATLFGGIFLRDQPSQRANQAQSRSWVSTQSLTERKKSTFVSHFLINDDPQLYQSVACLQ